MQAKTTALNVSGGDFDLEGIETFGGKIARLSSRNDIEISLDGVPVGVGDFDWLFANQTSATITSSTTSTTGTKYRIAFLWTDQTGVSSATSSITGTNQAYRNIYADAYCTGMEKSMDAGDKLSATLTFKLTSEDTGGAANFKFEHKDTTSGTMAATPAYTTVAKW